MSIKGFNINLHPSIKSKNLDFTSMKIGGIEIKITLLRTQLDFCISSKSIIFGPNKLSIGEKVFISNSSQRRKEQLNNIKLNYGTNDYLENTYSKILNNIEENTGLSGLIQKYNPNYKLKLKIIDDAIDRIGNSSNLKKKDSFTETEISMLNSNKNNENSQLNEIVINSNLNDSKYGNNGAIQLNSVKGNETKGKKFKIIYIYKLSFNFRNKEALLYEKKFIFC
jgi:hypothetical protein